MFKNSNKSEIGDLSDGEIIIAIETKFPIIQDSTDLDGPYFDLKGLINNSKIYGDLKKRSPKRANKIIQKENIKIAEGMFFSPKDRIFDFEFIRGFVHSVFGNFKNEEVTGIHFYDESKIKIKELIDTNSKGVWRAKIEVLDPYSNKWREKQKPTDFFPKEWDRTIILDELYFANMNKKIKNGTNNVYEGVTKSGINVIFIIENNKIKTIYPILNLL